MNKTLIISLLVYLFLLQGCTSWQEMESRRYKYQIGMTKQQVLGSIDGYPMRTLKQTTALGTEEIWIYAGPTYLYFDRSGILRRIDSPF
ncbi:hypothetical protein IHQ56_01275 [Methylobacillus flagellatus]|uniref:hypothetical protein n=1 Tax=Methylobacillus TaxID=404 RepID=UPI0028538D8E|nr:hypothetical protein [Methylobacillus flagellatus]MDR5170440.1 hypothetical protein [Methylobacillus flagellatus]